MEKKVLVLTVHYRSARDCIKCMESVGKSSYSNWMHVVLDNASPDDSPTILSEYFKASGNPVQDLSQAKNSITEFRAGQSLLLLHNENKGFASGNNEVLKRILDWDCYVWLLNPDVMVSPEAMGQLVSELSAKPDRILGTSVYSWYDSSKFLHSGGYRINWLLGSVKPLQSAASAPDYIYGASLFTDIGTFRKTGLIPEDYFLYWEESHWCQLARQKGIILSLIPEALVYDKVGGITGRGFMAFYYYTRNGLRFISTFRPRYTPIVFFLNFIRALFKLLRFNAGAARGIFKGNLDFVRHAFFPKK